MSETMEKAVRHSQKHSNSGRLKSCVEVELEAEVKEKKEWEKEVSDLADDQTAAEVASTKACDKFRKLSENRASAEKILEKTEEKFKKYEKMVVDTTVEEEVGERKRKADDGLEASVKKIAKLMEELAGINEANQKKVTKRHLVDAMKDTAMVYGWELDDMVRATPLHYVEWWYLDQGYKVEWTGDPEGPDFPTDGAVVVLLDSFVE